MGARGTCAGALSSSYFPGQPEIPLAACRLASFCALRRIRCSRSSDSRATGASPPRPPPHSMSTQHPALATPPTAAHPPSPRRAGSSIYILTGARRLVRTPQSSPHSGTQPAAGQRTHVLSSMHISQPAHSAAPHGPAEPAWLLRSPAPTGVPSPSRRYVCK
ncbi:hypothetical protein HYPSUDRAFT_768952 [Hypholoma sublateritium FD-334 SS-4]|uniref:Uncharacterized protein n=1 Tax=Hypholoma sublateritium (strain FD-334 SS-4) TaxID=945553 RepID=A0A0D2L2E9_HYPSF|nr:hypothetical protein HYPSUDRAFT_768952 [Hypholoma sublateritium FD-334 SS-4]